MPDSFEQLKADAADTLERGMACDRIVLRAIGLGCDTRRAIKDATGFDYAAIEKALEREAGTVRFNTKGMIERISLAGDNGTEAVESAQNGNHKAVGLPMGRPPIPIDHQKAEDLRAQGKTMGQIADALGINRNTFTRRRQQDDELEAALDRGRERYMQSGEEKEVSPMGYIEEPPETKPEAPTSVKVSRLNSITGARSVASPTSVVLTGPVAADLAEPSTPKVSARKEPEYPDPPKSEKVFSMGGAMVVVGDDLRSLKERVAKILYIEDPNSPVLAEALLEVEREITAKILTTPGHALESPEDLLAVFNKLPSALLKEIREDDAWFMNAYETLIGILDDRMDGDKKAAVWTLILYLKSLERERYGKEN